MRQLNLLTVCAMYNPAPHELIYDYKLKNVIVSRKEMYTIQHNEFKII